VAVRTPDGTTDAPAAATPAKFAEKATESLFGLTPVSGGDARLSLNLRDLPPTTDLTLPSAAVPVGAVSRRGILIADPVAESGVDDRTQAFTAGCGEWLELTVAGLPEISASPLLTSIGRAQRELQHTHDLRLTLEDAQRFAKTAGATDVAVGQVASEASGTMQLTYTVYDVATGKVKGAPIVRTGTAEQIRAALPGIAAEVARQVGIAKPAIPTSVDAGMDDLALLGRTCWTDSISADDKKALLAAAPHSALTAVCALAILRGSRETDFQGLTDRLLTQLAPSNTLAWGSVAYMNTLALLPHAAHLDALRRAYPHNYALAHTDVWRCRSIGNPRGEYRAATDAVKGATDNPDAWLSLGWTLSTEANKLRRARTADALDANEWAFLNRVYPLWEKAVVRATELDPVHEVAWNRVAEAATFAGDRRTASDAYWKSEQYNRDKAGAYEWGLQMFQPKWGGDPGALATVAEHAQQTDFLDTQEAGQVARALRSAGQTEAATALLNRALAKAEAAIAKNPNDPAGHWDRASILYFQDRKPASCREYATVARLLPDRVKAQYDYGYALLDMAAADKAIPVFRHVLELDPGNTDAPLRLGRALKERREYAEAEKWARVAIARAPNSVDAHFLLGEICQWGPTRRHSEAAKEFRRCADLSPVPGAALYAFLVFALNDAGSADEAVHWGETGVAQYEPFLKDQQMALLKTALAAAYVSKKRYQEAIDLCAPYIAASPQDINANEVIGDAYNGVGRRADARKSWQIVVDRCPYKDDPEGVTHAKEMLAKYPDNGK